MQCNITKQTGGAEVEEKANKQPNQKMARRPKQIFLRRHTDDQ